MTTGAGSAGTVIIRADGGPNIGGGHIVRAKTIAEELTAEGCGVCLMVKDDDWSRGALDGVKAKKHFLKKTDNESLIVLQTARRLGAGLVILDVRDTSPEYVRYLQESGAAVVTIDDAGRGADAADATFWGGVKDRREKNYYYGPAYTIVPPNLLEMRKKSLPPSAVRAVVCFLGTFDPRNHGKNVPALAEEFPQVSFFWFCSGDRMQKGNLQVMHLSRDLFFEKLLSADLALISGGITLFEAAALGRPAMVFPQADHETAHAELFAAAGAAVLVPASTAKEVSETFRSFVNGPQSLRAMHAAGLNFVDGRGMERFKEVVLRLLARKPAHAG